MWPHAKRVRVRRHPHIDALKPAFQGITEFHR